MLKKIIFLSILICTLYACSSDTHRMEGFEVHGIDISHHQSYINWDTVASQPIDFAFVKATEGETFSDSLFSYNWNEMSRVEIKRGAYHFFRPNISVENQAKNFIDQVDLKEGDLPPVLDVEVFEGISERQLLYDVQEWLNIIEAHYNVKPIIYTYHKAYKKYITGNFDEYPIWIARYSTSDPTLSFGNSWSFWQYGNRGAVKGIEGFVDLNVFNGSIEDLEKLGVGESSYLSFF